MPPPSEVSRALAALRCLPCLVGSFAATADSRREAIRRPLDLIEELLAVWPAPHSNSAAKNKRASSATQGEEEEEDITAADGDSERRRQRNEAAVLRAFALEAGVGLLCLLPAESEEALERLLRWHGR